MTENTLELLALETGSYKVTICTTDGITFMEVHRKGLTDADVLRKINVDRYNRLPGEWILTIPREHKVFRDPELSKVISAAISYMWDRDHPQEYDDYFV